VVPNLTFSPAAGHLLPKADTEVFVTYLVDSPSRLDNIAGNLVAIEIAFTEPSVVPWSAERVASSVVAAPATVRPKSTGAKGDADKQVAPLTGPPEPLCEQISQTKKEIPFKVRSKSSRAIFSDMYAGKDSWYWTIVFRESILHLQKYGFASI
jgi:hypothetical protein